MGELHPESCTGCRYSARPPGGIAGLICRRFPPTPHLVNSPTGPMALPVFAPVDSETVCGEYARAPVTITNEGRP